MQKHTEHNVQKKIMTSGMHEIMIGIMFFYFEPHDEKEAWIEEQKRMNEMVGLGSMHTNTMMSSDMNNKKI